MSENAALRNLVRSGLMLLPGGAGMLALVGLATGRLGGLSELEASQFLVFSQVELLAVGVGRMGFDQLVLGRASRLDNGDDLGFLGLLARVIVPVTLVVSAICALVLGWRVGAVLGIGLMLSAPFDVVSTVTGSFELGRRRYAANIAFSWMNYPVFLLGLVVPWPGLDTSRLSHIVGLFCTTSIIRGLVAIVLLGGHRGRQARRPSAPLVRLAGPDLADAGLASVCQVATQRADGLVLALLGGQFPLAAVSSYLLAARLLDASFTVSAVVASLRQVAQGGVERLDWHSRELRMFSGAWVGMWLSGAAALALLDWDDPGEGWGRLLLAAIAASLYLAVFRHVLVALAIGPEAQIGRRFLGYVAVTVVCAAVAVAVGEPAVMFVPTIVNGAASLAALMRGGGGYRPIDGWESGVVESPSEAR